MKLRSANIALALSTILASFAGATLLSPSTQMTLKVNGTDHQVPVGEPFKIKVGRKTFKMLLTSNEKTAFAEGSLQFDYGADMKFATLVETEAVSSWSMTGEDTTLTVTRYTGLDLKTAMKIAVDATITTFGQDKVIQSTTKYKVLGKKVEAVRLQITSSGILMQQDYIPIKGKGDAFILVVQDTSGKKNGCDETLEVVKRVIKSLKIRKPK